MRPGKPPIFSRIVTAPTKVRRIISWIDRMQIVQPGAYSCPALRAGQPVVTLAFRAAARKPILAQASLTDYGFDSGPCNPISVTIAGRRQKPLTGGDILSRLHHLLGVHFR